MVLHPNALAALEAAETGDVEQLQALLSQSDSLALCEDEDGYTPLHRAAYNDHPEACSVLITHGANVRARTHDGWEPLHSACRWGATRAASVLLQNGADPNARTNGGLTPLQLAIEHAHKGTVELLLYGHPRADINVLDADGNPLRESARRRGYDAMFDWV